MLLGAVLWAVFVFAASIAPKDAAGNATAWLGLLSVIPQTVLSIAASPVVLAITFLIIGVVLGWRLKGLQDATPKAEPERSLGYDMLEMASRLENASMFSSATQLTSAINSLSLRAARLNFDFPNQSNGFRSTQHFLPYLYNVGQYLVDGETEIARNAAKQFSVSPPSPQSIEY